MQYPDYAEGTPCWIDLATTDLDGAKAFYSELFGWSFDDIPPEQGGPYTMVGLDGAQVAGLAQGPAGFPPTWSTYLAVDDCERSTQRAVAAGASIMMPPMEAMGLGKMSFVVDPQGAHVGFWQAMDHQGAELVNAPGAFTWSELIAPDADSAAMFYREAVGLQARTEEYGGGRYMMLHAGDRAVAGVVQSQRDDAPGHWQTYFGVGDCDNAAEKAAERGGSVILSPSDARWGLRTAVLADPQGAEFSIVEIQDA